MRAVLVVVLLELEKLPLEISPCPEQHAIQTFAPRVPISRSTTGCERGTSGHRLDFPDVQDPQVRLALMKPVRGIMVRPEVGWQGWPHVA
jgi:hypothetical protein